VLHVDQNEYYGGAEAAFSLQEVEEWVTKVNAGKLVLFVVESYADDSR
jgi:RAB protein geranylgeranyltransferase component A